MNFVIALFLLLIIICLFCGGILLEDIAERLLSISSELEDINKTHTKLTKVIYLLYKEKKNGNPV